jgi:hypothetical protein
VSFSGEQINKLQYILTMVYYSAIKRNEPSNHKKKEEPSMQVAN